MFWIVVLLLLAGAGFFFYQKMMAIEQEIRAEQEEESVAETEKPAETEEPPVAEEKVEKVEEETSDPPVVTPEVEKMAAKAEPVDDKELTLEDEILAAVQNLPGIKQTELYSSFSDVSKKQLQQLFKEMDDSGKLKREKKGSSYLLYPL